MRRNNSSSASVHFPMLARRFLRDWGVPVMIREEVVVVDGCLVGVVCMGLDVEGEDLRVVLFEFLVGVVAMRGMLD